MDKSNVVHIRNRILSSQNKGLNQPHVATPIKMELTMLNEASQAQKDNYYMISLILWNIISLNLIKLEMGMERLGRGRGTI